MESAPRRGRHIHREETGVAMKVETERIKDRFNHNVFPLGYQVVLKGTEMG